VEGFETLMLWLEKQGIKKVHACLEATGNYGEDLAIYLHEAGHNDLIRVTKGYDFLFNKYP
jgi:transposase